MSARTRQLTALAISLALLAGIPIVLTTVTWPEVNLSAIQLRVYVQSGRLPPGLGPAVLMGLLWVLWALYLLAALTEVYCFMRGHRVRLRLLGPLQIMAATALGATVTAPAAHATPAPPEAAVSVPTSEQDRVEDASPQQENNSETAVSQERSRVLDGFGYDSEALTDQMRAELSSTEDLIAAHGAPESPVVITGHTDSAGGAEYNEQLSERRAQSVADYLRDQLGEQAPPIETRGYGPHDPIPGAEDDEQRRVEITYTVTAQPSADTKNDETSDDADANNEPSEPEPSDEQQRAVVLVLPSGGVLIASALTAGLAGSAGGFLLARRVGTRNAPALSTAIEDVQSTQSPLQDREEQPAADQEHAVPPAEPVDPREVVELTLASGLGLQGPGASGTLRSLIPAALATADEHTPTESSIHLVLCPAGLNLTDQATLNALATVPSVQVADTLPEALDVVHQEVIARHTLLEEANVEHIRELDDGQDCPPVVLMAAHEQAYTDELASLLASAETTNVTAVHGHWPQVTVSVDETGLITEATASERHWRGARWPTLTRAQLTDLVQEHNATTSNQGQPASTTAPAPVAEEEGEPSATEEHPVQMSVLGRLRIHVNGRQVELRRNTSYEVATHLAVHPEGVRREQAIDQMWPEDDPRTVMRRWHDAISDIRKTARPAGGQEHPPLVQRSGTHYQLDPTLIQVDLWELTEALEAAEQAITSSQRREHLQRGLDLYTDELAAGEDYAWVESTRTLVRRRLLQAVREHADQADTSEALEASRLLNRVLTLDPTDEPTHAQLIRLYLNIGDIEAADRSYERCVEALSHIDAEPSAQIKNLL